MYQKGNDFFAEEIADVIKGRQLLTFPEYQRVERYGRDKGLRRDSQRPFVWEVYQTYHQEMRRENLYDYEDLPLLALEALGNEGDGALYEAVIVDEAQDLRPVEVDLVARIAGGRRSPRLTLLADPQQSIYYKGISWREAGVEVMRGMPPLAKNFRNTRQILEAAWSLASHGVEEPGDLVPPETTSRHGPKPCIVVRENWRDQLQAVEEIVLRLCQPGRYNPGDFAVLAYERDQVRELKNRLRNASIPVVHYRDEAFDIREYNVKTVTMHSAKGLEWPIVIVAGLQQGKLPWNTPSGDRDEEVESGTARQRKVLYVAMTRAMQELYMVTSPPTSAFLDEIDRESVAWDTSAL
jgi:superfamily I DNA/RNA helicase